MDRQTYTAMYEAGNRHLARGNTLPYEAGFSPHLKKTGNNILP